VRVFIVARSYPNLGEPSHAGLRDLLRSCGKTRFGFARPRADAVNRWPFPMSSRLPLVRSLTVLLFVLAAPVLALAALKVACVGDSITAGYALADPARDAYPAQLARLLSADYEVRNFGVSAATLMDAGNYTYRTRPAHDEALAWRPDVVVIALGTNDTKVDNIAKHPDDFVPSYRGLIGRFRAANPGAKIVLCLPRRPPRGDGHRRERARGRILPRIPPGGDRGKAHAARPPHPLADAALHFPDKIHPDPEAAGRIARLVYGEVMFATTPAAQSLDPAVNTAVVPVPRLEDDCYNWWTRHAEVLAARATAAPDVVLIGDSITHFWAGAPRADRVNGPQAWAATFGARRVLNLGFGWDRTQNVLWRLEHGEFEGLQPKLVVLNIGTNNFAATPHSRANTPEEVAAGIRAIREKIRALSPETHVLVMGVLPRGHQPGDFYRAPITALNALLAREFTGDPKTTFLDISARFLDAQGRMAPELMPDGTHPSEAGYAIWGRALVESGLLPEALVLPASLWPVALENTAISCRVTAPNALELVAPANTDLYVAPNGKGGRDLSPRVVFQPEGPFLLTAKIEPEFRTKWDAGVLLLYSDATHFAKFCYEMDYRGTPRVVSVVANGAGDECTSMPVPEGSGYFRIAGSVPGETFTLYSSSDGRTWYMLRSFRLTQTRNLRAGLGAQSPVGEGCRVRFSEISVERRMPKDFWSGE
jgi:lysophospholipase L1-like esterase/regulation of enolase protein 1 (concanavalin A-like superfamily)